MLATAARRGTMPNAHRIRTTMSNSSNGKNSLTFESVVCSQLELKRRAASFSRRRSTMCRRPSIYTSTTSTSSVAEAINPSRMSVSIAEVNPCMSILDTSQQYLTAKRSNNESKRSQTSSSNSVSGTILESTGDRQSIGSMFYWDASPAKSPTSKQDGSRASKWSIDFHKETPHYGSLRSRLIEEYTDSESLLEFAKKTILVLMKTKAATIFLGVLLILPITMMSIGVSHLSDCPIQENLPIYLFVAGIVWTTKLLQNIWHKYRLQQKFLNDEESSSDRSDGHVFIDGLMTSFLVVWFFLGHYWLITIGYPPQFEQPLETPDTWCHKTVVICTLASIVITYFILTIFISFVILLVVLTRYTIIEQASAN